MPQVLKEEVRTRVLEAATRVFAERGYDGARMPDVARLAGVSTGNIYRYFAGKDALFYEIVDDGLVARFESLVTRRVRALQGVDDVRRVEATTLYRSVSEELLRFCLDHRLAVAILLGGAAGSRYEGFAERMVERLTRLAIAHFRGLDPSLRVTEAVRLVLVEIYRSFVRMLLVILTSSEDETKIRRNVEAYTRYHLAGLNALFEVWPAPGGPPQDEEDPR